MRHKSAAHNLGGEDDARVAGTGEQEEVETGGGACASTSSAGVASSTTGHGATPGGYAMGSRGVVNCPNMDTRLGKRRSPRVAAMEARAPPVRPAAGPAAARKKRARATDMRTGKRQRTVVGKGAEPCRYVQRTSVAAGPLKYMIKVGPTMIRRMETSGKRRDAAAASAHARQTQVVWDDGG